MRIEIDLSWASHIGANKTIIATYVRDHHKVTKQEIIDFAQFVSEEEAEKILKEMVSLNVLTKNKNSYSLHVEFEKGITDGIRAKGHHSIIQGMLDTKDAKTFHILAVQHMAKKYPNYVFDKNDISHFTAIQTSLKFKLQDYLKMAGKFRRPTEIEVFEFYRIIHRFMATTQFWSERVITPRNVRNNIDTVYKQAIADYKKGKLYDGRH